MGSTTNISARALLLRSSLNQLQHAADRMGASDTIHYLRNCVLTAQGALGIVEARLAASRNDDLEQLIELAETRLREGRALIARSQQTRWRSAQFQAAA